MGWKGLELRKIGLPASPLLKYISISMFIQLKVQILYRSAAA
jgi:hypothetical protein